MRAAGAMRALLAAAVVFLATAPVLSAADLDWKLARPEDYPPGTIRHLIFYDAFLVADEEGIYALSGICNLRGGPIFCGARDPRGEFVCRRCLTLYARDGKPVVGACRLPMDWLRLELKEDGFLHLYPEYRGETGKKIPHPFPLRRREIPFPGTILIPENPK